jgi:hypothetical protein
MDTPKVNLRFELSELLALQQLATKHHTDLGGILRLSALAMLELDRRGALRMERIVEGITSHLSGGRREN